MLCSRGSFTAISRRKHSYGRFWNGLCGRSMRGSGFAGTMRSLWCLAARVFLLFARRADRCGGLRSGSSRFDHGLLGRTLARRSCSFLGCGRCFIVTLARLDARGSVGAGGIRCCAFTAGSARLGRLWSLRCRRRSVSRNCRFACIFQACRFCGGFFGGGTARGTGFGYSRVFGLVVLVRHKYP